MNNKDQQIDQMCSFILQEAKEKVNELRLKTQHDANLESSMMIHAAKTKIQSEMKDQEKRIVMEERVRVSRAEAELRVRKMRAREELLEGIKKDAIQAMASTTSDKTAYGNMLRDLIVQGLIKLNEPKVSVIVRESDVEITKSILDAAKEKYIQLIREATSQTPSCSLEVNPSGRCLPPASDGSGRESCAGGVKLTAYDGRIVCDNTLDSRLATVFDQLMPEIRAKLFSIRV